MSSGMFEKVVSASCALGDGKLEVAVEEQCVCSRVMCWVACETHCVPAMHAATQDLSAVLHVPA